MKIEYRAEDFKLISSLHAWEKKSRWYKHFLSHRKLKIEEQYHSDTLFAVHYYLNPKTTNRNRKAYAADENSAKNACLVYK